MKPFHVIDADGHVIEPLTIYPEYVDPQWRGRVPTTRPYKMLNVGRPLGMPEATEEVPRPMENSGTLPGGAYDPHVRIKDMDKEGVDVAVCFPSLATSLCCLEDVELEAAMLTAYNRWMADHCAPYPERLKGVLMTTMRDMTLAVREIPALRRGAVGRGHLCVGPHGRQEPGPPGLLSLVGGGPGAGTADPGACRDGAAALSPGHP
jgi:predicted TIM-barrel fold metal-dependent hydrolase